MEQQTVDIAPFLAAVIEEFGGAIKIPYASVFNEREQNVALAVDIEDDGASLVLRLVNMDEVDFDE